MKIDKSFIILLSIIIILLIIISFNKLIQDFGSNIPKVKEIKNIDKIEVFKNNKPDMIFILSNNKWWFLPEEYPAEPSNIEKIINDIKKIKLTDLISRSGYYEKYDLDDLNKIIVKVYYSNKIIRELNIGKPGPTYQHTYITIDNNKNVYYAKGNYRDIFSKDRDAYCSKVLVKIPKEEISEIIISEKGKEYKMVKSMRTEISSNTNVPSKTITEWYDENKNIWDNNIVTKILDRISPLNASKIFNGKKKDFVDNVRSFKIKSPSGETEFTIYGFTQDTNYIVGISGIDSLYLLPEQAAKDLLIKLK